MATKKKTPLSSVDKPDSSLAASKPVPAFPKKELNKWLKAHKIWDHDDWLQFLDDLKTKGYSDLVNNLEGQDSVGFYLETNRKN